MCSQCGTLYYTFSFRVKLANVTSTSREAFKRPLPRDFDGINGNLSEAEWDYEAMGMSYEQLMEYFDNLKESTA